MSAHCQVTGRAPAFGTPVSHSHRRPNAQDLDWQLHARCRGLPTEMFFPSDGERGQLRAAREERAKKVCRSCPVKRECLRYALSSVEAWGVWGATTPRERQLIDQGLLTTRPTGSADKAPPDRGVAGSLAIGDRDQRKPV